MKDNEILQKYEKNLPSIILNHYHIFISTYIVILIAFSFTDYYFRQIPELILTRIAPVTLGIFLLIIKFSKLKKKNALVKTVNNLFCISILMMGFTILIITFHTPIFKSSIAAVIIFSVTVYFLVKGRRSIIIVYSTPLVFMIFYVIYFIKPSPEQAQELMNPFAIYLGTFIVSYLTEKSRIKEFSLITRLKIEKEKTQQLLHDKQAQNKLLSLQKEEIEKSRNQLKELNTNKDRFFSIIAHDLKNPIAAFLGHTEFLAEDYKSYSDDERIQLFKEINKSTTRISNLLDNLLEWARLQIKNISFYPEKIRVKDLINNTLDVLSEQAKLKHINIKLNITDSLFAYADQNMFKSVLRNLISNAIKFSFEGSDVIISASEYNNLVKVSVVDKGVGLSEKEKEMLFRIEKYISNPGTNQEKGTGLGLILCKEFIEKNGGDIWVESEPNKGSSFNFTLPVAEI